MTVEYHEWICPKCKGKFLVPTKEGETLKVYKDIKHLEKCNRYSLELQNQGYEKFAEYITFKRGD